MRVPVAAVFVLALLAPLAAAQSEFPPPDLAHRDLGLALVESGDGATWSAQESVVDGGGVYYAWFPPSATNLRISFPDAPNATLRSFLVDSGDRVEIRAEDDGGSMAAHVRLDFLLPAPGGSGLPLFHVPGPVRIGSIVLFLRDGESAPASFHRSPSDDGLRTNAWRMDFVAPAPLSTIPLTPLSAAPADAPAIGVVVLACAVLALLVGAFATRRLSRDEPAQGGILVHLRALQQRILVPLYAFAFFNLLFFAFGTRFVSFGGLTFPTLFFSVQESIAAVAFRTVVHQFVPAGVTLIVTRPVDAVLTELEVTLFLAIVATLPLLAYELGGFLTPALRASERKLASRAVPVVVVLFAAGVSFAYFLIVPTMMHALYTYTAALGATPLLAVEELVSFALIVTLVFGLAFELPAVMFVLSRFGIVKAAWWGSKWRHAIVAIFVVAAIVTPDPSVVSQFLVAVPLVLLYFLGWGASAMAARRAEPSG